MIKKDRVIASTITSQNVSGRIMRVPSDGTLKVVTLLSTQVHDFDDTKLHIHIEIDRTYKYIATAQLDNH